MKTIKWNREKNGILKDKRGVCFEDVTTAVNEGNLLDRLRHPNADKYPNQWVMVVKIGEYVYSVPYVEEDDYYFLKTIIPSRKYKKRYLK